MKYTLNLLFVLCALTVHSQLKYPVTKKSEVTDVYFGTTYTDPYRWLEDSNDTTVVSWFRRQAELSNSVFNSLAGRDELIAEWRKLDKLQPPRYGQRKFENGRVFYRKTMPGAKIGKLYFREGIQGEEQLLFDPAAYKAGKTLTVEDYVPSYDAKQIAIAYSEAGAEVSTIKIMNVDTRKFLDEEIYPSDGIEGWTFDNKAIFYGWIKSADNKDPLSRLNPKSKMHLAGSSVKTDIDFFSNESYPELQIDPKNYPFIELSASNKEYVFSGEGSVQQEYAVYYAPYAQLKSKIQWKVLCKPSDKLVRGMEFMNGKVYAITYADAKNYKLVSSSLNAPDWKTAVTVVAEKSDQTLEELARSRDFLFLTYSDGINGHIYRYKPADGVIDEIKLPFAGTASISCMNKQTNNCTVGISSWNRPFTEFEFDASTGVFKPSSFNKAPVYPAAYTDLVVKEVEVKGHDGVMIPLSIIYRNGIKLDGNNVCLMDGYGAYGISMTPWFSYRETSLAVRGVVIAIPHVRGGSEKGEEWYKGGYKTTKPNTWKDFNSCAEYLIGQGYTKSSKLAGTGTSAGGILISRAITERPDLYAAAICNVGCANTLRGEFTANGPVNTPEFGTVKDSIEARALYEMDGMQHVVPGTSYPAVICVGGWNDPRVVAWQPGKFAAALQNASVSGKPVLMKVNYDNGHFTQDKEVTFSNFADQYAFVLWQCGHPDFQINVPEVTLGKKK